MTVCLKCACLTFREPQISHRFRHASFYQFKSCVDLHCWLENWLN